MSVELEGLVRDPRLLSAARVLGTRAVPAWITGGAVRDTLLGRSPDDLDVTVDGDPVALGRKLASDLAAAFVLLDADRRHVRLVLPEGGATIDLTPLRAESIEADLRQRDYTIDAMAVELWPPTGNRSLGLIDPTGGREDLRDGIVRATSEAALLDDPVRLLRGARLAATLNFRIEETTRGMIAHNARRLRRAAPERRRDELVPILGAEKTASALSLLDDLGLFAVMFPEMDVTRDVEQPKEHEWDVMRHSLAAVEALDAILAEREPAAERERQMFRAVRSGLPWAEMSRFLNEQISTGINRRALLKLAALLHDVGKPATKTREADGRIRFLGHADLGAEIAGRLMRRLRFPSGALRFVRSMVRAHLRPLQLAQSGKPTNRAVYRFFRDTGEAALETLVLSLADHAATAGPRLKTDEFRRHVALVAYILRVREEKPAVVKPLKLVRGDELASALGIEEGPVLGELLEKIREAQAAGEVNDRDGAIALGSRLLERSR